MQLDCPRCGQHFEAAVPSPDDFVVCPQCGHRFPDPEATVVDDLGPFAAGGVGPGKELGGFRIDEKVGTGAMGVVYRATQLSLGRTVALKVLPSAYADRPAFVKRFYEESMALSALNHPNVVTIIERGNVGRIYYFVMEYIDGPSLQELMKRPFPLEQLPAIARETASALSYAHRQGVVHRDIKPSNIMLNSEGQVKVADFGLAGLMTQQSPEPENGKSRPRRMGTPAYMSPEQKKSPLDVDGRTDIFSMGVVLHELTTGVRPEIPLRGMPSDQNMIADPRLDAVIAKCLEPNPDDRYQTAAELLQDIQRYESELRRAPRCPNCGKLSAVRFQRCAYCDTDMELYFDVCPECRSKNRREVRHCLSCGVDLERGRTLVSNKVAMMLDRADRLRLNGDFEEAVQILEEVQAVEGKTFEQERERARALRQRVLAERMEAARRDYQQAKRLVREHRFQEAIRLFQRVPSDIKDTTDAIAATKEIQARLAAERRSESTTNIILVVIAIVLILIIILFAVQT
jgi:tetratricopeptide (TPR) repeat protein